jgi:hypothetical protein
VVTTIEGVAHSTAPSPLVLLIEVAIFLDRFRTVVGIVVWIDPKFGVGLREVWRRYALRVQIRFSSRSGAENWLDGDCAPRKNGW